MCYIDYCNVKHFCLTVVFLDAIICLTLNNAPSAITIILLLKGGGGAKVSVLFLSSPSLSQRVVDLFGSQLASIRCLNAVQRCLSSNRNADDTCPAAACPPPPPHTHTDTRAPPSASALACSSTQRAIKTQGGLVLCA